MPVRCCSSLSTLTTASKFLFVSASVSPFGSHVAVVERVVGSAQLLDELERRPHATHRILDRVAAVVPRPDHGSRAERITARSAKRVPVDDAEAKMLLHRLAFHDLVFVVPAERQRILRCGAFKSDLPIPGNAAMERTSTWRTGVDDSRVAGLSPAGPRTPLQRANRQISCHICRLKATGGNRCRVPCSCRMCSGIRQDSDGICSSGISCARRVWTKKPSPPSREFHRITRALGQRVGHESQRTTMESAACGIGIS